MYKEIKTMATKKTVKSTNVFGWTSIESNSMNALSNDWHHVDELRRELQGKEICEKSIIDAIRKVGFAKYGTSYDVGVHSFFPDKGICYVGRPNRLDNTNGVCANVRIKWDVESIKQTELLNEVKALKELVAKLVK